MKFRHTPDEEVSDEVLRRRISRRGWSVGICIMVGVLYAGLLGWISLQNHQIIQDHSGELTQVKGLEISATNNHGSTLGWLEAICESTPGCIVVHNEISRSNPPGHQKQARVPGQAG